MERKIIVVGDGPACGGTVLPYESRPKSTINDHSVALMGGRVFCEVCRSVGFIAKAGGPYRPTLCEVEQVLEGDVVVCQCPDPSPLISKKQSLCTCEDRSGITGKFSVALIAPGWYRPDPQALTSSKELVDGFVTHPSEVDKGDRICPNQTNAEFHAEMLVLRNRGIYLINRKLRQLSIWDRSARDDVREWFGKNDIETREFLQKGLARCIVALKELNEESFVRYSDEFARRISCAVDDNPMAVAGVCKTDTKSKVIGIAVGFCNMPRDSGQVDSKLGTLIHEVTHFDDVFGTDDHVYHFRASRAAAKIDSALAKNNADSITGYVMWETNFDS